MGAEGQAGPSRIRRWMAAGASGLLSLVFVAMVAALVAAVGLAWAYNVHVLTEPGSHLERKHIRSIIAQESPVYYRDGETRVGVFFDAEHRRYVGWEELPEAYVVALVAAEDDAYWRHFGINIRGLVRAIRDNALAGRVVAGGSTLTQQTAKNLYYRPDRSVRSKLVELLNALRLEAHYDKREIFTFYANQFHVTGNGRGLGIAARHFFDKDVDELSLVESAFLAGLVKAPAHYDPFLGDADRRAAAVERPTTAPAMCSAAWSASRPRPWPASSPGATARRACEPAGRGAHPAVRRLHPSLQARHLPLRLLVGARRGRTPPGRAPLRHRAGSAPGSLIPPRPASW